MATTQIPNLPQAIALNGTEPFIAVQAGVSVQVSAAQIAAYAASVAPANVSSFSAGTTGFTPSVPTNGAIVLSGTLNVAHGGTGAATLTANGVLLGNGTSAVTAITGTSSQVLIGGSPPAFGALTSLAVTSFSAGTTGLTPSSPTAGAIVLAGTLVSGNGGTGFSTYTKGDLLYASATDTLSKLAIGSTGQVIVVAAGLPSWATPTPVSGSGGEAHTGSTTLIASSPGAQTITTTDYGQFIKLPDATTMTKAAVNFNVLNAGGYPLKVLDGSSNILGYIYPGDSSAIGCDDSSSTAGVWNCTGLEIAAITARLFSTSIFSLGAAIRVVALDADRTLITMGAGATTLTGVVYTTSTASFGATATIRSSASNHATIKTAADTVLVTSCNATTGFDAVVLTFAGNIITVHTADRATATNAANIASNGFTNIINVGSAWVTAYTVATPANTMRAITLSGTVPTIGTEASMTGTLGTFVSLYDIDATNFVTLSMTTGTAVYAKPFSISGTTISGGTEASVTGLTGCTGMITSPISSGVRWVMIYRNAAGTAVAASIVSVAATVATLSTVNLVVDTSVNIAANAAAAVDGSKLILAATSSKLVNILTDSSGTASAGTSASLEINTTVVSVYSASTNIAKFLAGTGSATTGFCVVDYSSSSPTVTAVGVVAGTFGMSLNQPYDSTRAMTLLVGTQTIDVSRIAAAVGPIGVARGNNITSRYIKLMPEINLNGAYRTNLAASGQNKLWVYAFSVTYADSGTLDLIEGVT